MMDAQSMINWSVIHQLVGSASELRASTAVVYHSDHLALAVAHFCHTDSLMTACSCYEVLWQGKK